MQVLERTKEEIEKKANSMSDFLKMEYFESCIKKKMGIEINKFCCIKLGELYGAKSMYSEAGKYFAEAVEMCTTVREKHTLLLNEA